MKKTATAIAMMTLVLIVATSAQPARRVAGSTALGGGSGVGVKNRQPRQIGNPFGLGGTVTAGVKNRQAANLGDTATHEVGHKGKRRGGAIGEGASDVNARRQTPANFALHNIGTGDGVQGRKPDADKYDGIDDESHTARTKNLNQPTEKGFVSPSTDPPGVIKRRKTQNLLPYVEQDNLYKTNPRQPNARRRPAPKSSASGQPNGQN